MQRKVDLNIWHNLHHDLPAGVVVFLVAVPLCLSVMTPSTSVSRSL
jgi:MFS superfamily sulfate permease-like transporter